MKRFSVFFVCLVVVLPFILADTITIPGSTPGVITDTWVDEINPDINYGNDTSIHIRNTTGINRFGYIQINLTNYLSLPNIINIELAVYYATGGYLIRTFNANCLNNMSTYITWNNRNTVCPYINASFFSYLYTPTGWFGLNLTNIYNRTTNKTSIVLVSDNIYGSYIYSTEHATYPSFITITYLNNSPFNITAIDNLTNLSIYVFNATVNSTVYNTTNGTIVTSINKSTGYANITVKSAGYTTRTYNHSLLTDLEAVLNPTSYNITLIDENTGLCFNVSNITSAHAYDDEHNLYQAFVNCSLNYSLLNTTKLRIKLTYPDGIVINRYLDFTLTNTTNIRVCANLAYITHYELLMLSNTEQVAILKNVYANCYVGAYHTIFAYEGRKMLPAFTTPSYYYLYTLDDDNNPILLTGINGGNALTIDLDSLQFLANTYNITLTRNFIHVQDLPDTTFNNTFLVYFVNVYDDNTAATMTISNAGNGSVYYSSSLPNPNNASVYFNYATLNISNSTTFLISVTVTATSGITTITKLYSLLSGELSEEEMPLGFAIIVSVVLVLVALTLVGISQTLGAFGVIIMIVAMVLVGFAPSGTYKTWVMGIYAIILLFMFAVIVKSKGKTLVTT